MTAFGAAHDIPHINSAEAASEGCAVAKLHKRSSWIVYGALLEGAVTRLALEALLDGFDVFVVADSCYSAEREYEDVFQARIRQSGGTIVTSRQLTLELNST